MMKKIYISRSPAIGRALSLNRSIALDRKPIPEPTNSKLNVILDTSILVSALMAESRGHLDDASYQVLDELKKDSFNLIRPHDLTEEYRHELVRLSSQKGFTQANIDEVISLVINKGYTGRSYVMPIVEPKDQDDRGVFNTTLIGIVDYVVSKDSRHLVKRKISNMPEKIKILLPGDFLNKLHSHTNV